AGEGTVVVAALPAPGQHLATGWPAALATPALARCTLGLEQSGEAGAVLEDDGGKHEADLASRSGAPHDLRTGIPAVHASRAGPGPQHPSRPMDDVSAPYRLGPRRAPRNASEASNSSGGTQRWGPGWACSRLSSDPMASKSAKALSRATSSSCHWSRTGPGSSPPRRL